MIRMFSLIMNVYNLYTSHILCDKDDGLKFNIIIHEILCSNKSLPYILIIMI